MECEYFLHGKNEKFSGKCVGCKADIKFQQDKGFNTYEICEGRSRSVVSPTGPPVSDPSCLSDYLYLGLHISKIWSKDCV